MSQKKNGNYYSLLTGFSRAVPIILSAVAVFVAVCYLAGDTGFLGNGIGALLLGLFSVGAYAIPVLLIAHAIFYAEDVAKKRRLSRLVFSIITVIIIAAIEYAITFWGESAPFDPVGFFIDKTAGGFVGSTIAFVLVKVLGPIGLIILAVATMAIYIAFFFAGKNSAMGRVLLAFLEVMLNILAAIEKGVKKCIHTAKTAKETKAKREFAKHEKELLDDQFFDVDNGIQELTISELGIKTSKSDAELEENVTLQGQVFHKSAVTEEKSKGEDVKVKTPEAEEITAATEEKKQISFSYGEDFDIFAKREFAIESTDFIKKDAAISEPDTFYGIDEDAANVFTKDFDPYNFEINEKVAAKPSTKAVSNGIEEVAKPLSLMSDEEIEKEKRRQEFEERKRRLLEKARLEDARTNAQSTRPAPEASQEEVTEAAEAPLAPVFTFESAKQEAPLCKAEPQRPAAKTVEFNVTNEPSSMREPISSASVRKTFEKHDARELDAERAADHIADIIASANPAYTRSFNESKTYMTVSDGASSAESILSAEDAYTESPDTKYGFSDSDEATHTGEGAGAAYAVPEHRAEYGYAEAADVSAEPSYAEAAPTYAQAMPEVEFRPYESPAEKVTEVKPQDAVADEIKIERTMLSPSPLTEEAAVITPRDSRYTVINEDIPPYEEEPEEEDADEDDTDNSVIWTESEPVTPVQTAPTASGEDEGTFFSFGDEDDDEAENSDSDVPYEEFPEEEAIITDEIPPEEQNPDVLAQRKLFSCLDDDRDGEPEKKGIDTTESSVTEEDEDAPPFEVDSAPSPAFSPISSPSAVPKAAPVSLVPASDTKREEKKKADYSSYEFPSLDILGFEEEDHDENIQEEIQENADKLIETLASFNVTASIKGVDRGPRITRYEVVPAKGVKVSSVMNLQDDIALGLAADGIRMEAPIPGKSAIGVEIPNKRSNTVRLRELLETDDFKNMKSKTAVCIGKDVAGQPVITDLAKMPHLLIAGATGMGKSVCINSLMISMLYKARPDEVKFIMIDPKQVEFTMYNGIPHLLVPVVSDAKQAAGALMWAVEEMERRYNRLNPLCVRNMEAYNEKVAANPALGEPMSRIIIVIDEFADLMLQVRDPVENLVMRIAQKARAAGIHLIIGTQRPAVNVITGTIKANVPSRISCKVASNVDSRTVLDASGAEKLLNKGDMLFSFAGSIKPLRVQGAFVADGEVEEIMEHLKKFSDGNSYDSSVMEEIERAAQKCSKKGSGGGDSDDDTAESGGEGYLNDRQFLDAVELAVNTGKISTSLIQRKISVGYGKAAKFIDIMEDMGIVGEPNGQRPRDVLISADEWREKLARTMID